MSRPPVALKPIFDTCMTERLYVLRLQNWTSPKAKQIRRFCEVFESEAILANGIDLGRRGKL